MKTIYYNPEKNQPLLDDFITTSDDYYNVALVIDRVIYYVTGYLCKQILRHFKCLMSVCYETN